MNLRSAIRLSATLIMASSGLWVALFTDPAPLSILVAAAASTLGLTTVSHAAHEAVHGHLSTSRSINVFLGRILHGMLLLHHDIHRRYHVTHHAKLGTEDDPEGFFGYEEMQSLSGYVSRLCRWAIPPSPMHLLHIREFVHPTDVTRSLGVRPRLLSLGTVATYALGYAVAASLAPKAVGVAFLVPLLILHPVLEYLMSLPEHFGLGHAESSAERARDIRIPRLLAWFCWNVNSHAAHHQNARVPGIALPPPVPGSVRLLDFHSGLIATLRARGAASAAMEME